MNPPSQNPEEPANTPAENPIPVLNPATFVPDGSSPQADLAALDAIATLETEEDTTARTQYAQTAPIEVDPMTPFVPEQPTITAGNILSDEPLQASPAQLNTNPFTQKAKSPKKLILALIVAIVLIGGAVAGYFVWKSTQTTSAAVSSKSNTGNQPGGTTTTTAKTPTDTASSVNSAATALEQDANNVDDSAYNDTTLSDATLYQN